VLDEPAPNSGTDDRRSSHSPCRPCRRLRKRRQVGVHYAYDRAHISSWRERLSFTDRKRRESNPEPGWDGRRHHPEHGHARGFRDTVSVYDAIAGRARRYGQSH